MMKAQIGILVPLSIALCLGSFALMKMRMKEFVKEEKKAKLQDVRLRVAEDVLSEYSKDWQYIESGMQTEKDEQEKLNKVLNEMNNGPLKKQLEDCKSATKTVTDNLASVEAELKSVPDANGKEKAAWEAEITALNEKLKAQSPICAFIKAGSSLPGICLEKKAEAKPQEAKPDAPKPEEPKKEEPKKEEPKQEAPKQ